MLSLVNNGVLFIRGGTGVQFVFSNVANHSSVVNIRATLSDSGSRIPLTHEFVDKFVVDRSA